MPDHKVLRRIAITSWVLTTGTLVAELALGNLQSILVYSVGISVATTVVASVRYLQATAIVPVREAFIHGYQLATKNAAAAQTARIETDLATVLKLPTNAWTVIDTQRQEAVGEVSNRGTHRRPRPRH